MVEVWREMAEDAVLVRSPADGGGRVVVEEGEAVQVGRPGRWAFRYVAGPSGIAVGGSVYLQTPPFWGWSAPQTDSPNQPGFTEVTTDADGIELVVEVFGQGMMRIGIQGRALRAEESLQIVYGEGLGASVDRYAERQEPFGFAVDGDGDGVRGWLEDLPTVDILPGPAVALRVTGPTTARPGEPFELIIASLDARANAAVSLAGAKAEVHARPGVEVPAEVTLDEHGRARVRVTVPETGLAQLGVTVGEMAAISDPVLVHESAPKIVWADLQIHTGMSDGTGTLDDVYAYARDVAGLDAVAITDHDHWGVRFLDREPAMWSEVVSKAAEWDEPGRFVAFPAYEWTSWLYGHRHVLYVGEPGPVFGSIDVDTRSPDGLWRALAPHDAITIAHHSAGGPVAVDWRFAPDPVVEPVTEVVSVHGSSESSDTPGRIYNFVEGNSVRDALARGYRLGMIGSTDGHDGHPGLSQLQGASGGLAAIFADELSREGIAEALRARRAYATNGVRLLLRFSVNGVPMGGAVPASADAGKAEVRVVAADAVAGIELIVDGAVLEVRTPEGSAVREAFELPLISGSWAYVRVHIAGGGVAWSSPIWVD